jgi:hypothetical protein
MEKSEIKSALIAACRKKLLDTIATLETAMADAQQQANDYGAPKDRYDAFRSQLLRRRDMMAQQLSKEMIDLKVLDKLESVKLMEIIGFGTVVITTEQNYFISIGLGKIESLGTTYFTISPMVPLGQAITRKKKDETVDFRGQKIKILDVF